MVKNRHSIMPIYNKNMIKQMKNLCCRGQPSVIGVDRTFNLGELFVTVTVFKQPTVVRKTSGEHPIFIGPMFLYGDAKCVTYCRFFNHLATTFQAEGCNMKNFIFGSDNKKAMTSALKYAFPDSTHVLCLRYIMGNVKDYLTNKVGISERNRKDLTEKLFGLPGVTSADDSVVFEERIKEVRKSCESHNADQFLAYLDKRLLPCLKENVLKPRTVRGVQDGWTNNNTESANHVLKCAMEWKQQPSMKFVEKLYKVILVQEKDFRRAITNTGSFVLSPEYGKLFIPPQQWSGMTPATKQWPLKLCSVAVLRKPDVHRWQENSGKTFR